MQQTQRWLSLHIYLYCGVVLTVRLKVYSVAWLVYLTKQGADSFQDWDDRATLLLAGHFDIHRDSPFNSAHEMTLQKRVIMSYDDGSEHDGCRSDNAMQITATRPSHGHRLVHLCAVPEKQSWKRLGDLLRRAQEHTERSMRRLPRAGIL